MNVTEGSRRDSVTFTAAGCVKANCGARKTASTVAKFEKPLVVMGRIWALFGKRCGIIVLTL
jgi:hypothetical protein